LQRQGVHNILCTVSDMNLNTVSSASLYSHLPLTSNVLLTTLLSQTLNLYISLEDTKLNTHKKWQEQCPFYTVQLFHEYRLPVKPETINICSMWTTLYKKTNFTQVLLLLLDLPLVFDSRSQLHHWTVTLHALKPDISLPPWKNVRHHSLQEIHSYRTSREIIIFREDFQLFLSWIKHMQSKPPISFY